MARFLSLPLVKQHLNIDASYTGDDAYIHMLCDVAQDSVAKHLDRDLNELSAAEGGHLPPAVTHAMLLMVGNLYANREPVTVGVSSAAMPLGFEYLIGLYQKHNAG